MPMHRIYATTGLYSTEEKQALAKAITSAYTVNPRGGPGLPPFYVVVLFIDLPEDSFFIGGEKHKSFVRFNVQHLARHFKNKEEKLGFMRIYEEKLKPFTFDKGLDWEVNIDLADPLTWHENGMSPPAPNTDGELLWFHQNKAIQFEGLSFSDLVQ
ncbi:hypothetical protein RSOLAG22IIIB_08201 [Rhizoctonia solani]|uniref:Tautomerase cis-CaaD-like domain-containing protein n=1 Tax=Rhizoctonia solani TaxID=456999 RepID=A0A0K6FRX8_9AGAM|nr:unnamed protein product [Rhizoctonia solani]CUA68948.1 hypothetical protein RSOLAG22IIIB_08201 [Rhizoctonia solani]